MEIKFEIIEEFTSLDISSSLLYEANLQESEYEDVCYRINAFKGIIKISYAWQLQLLTGQVDFFIEHWDKQDDDANNVIFYAIYSESYDALQWIYENHLNLFNEYDTDKFIHYYSGIASYFKSESLLNWILKYGNFAHVENDSVLNVLVVMGDYNWIKGLDKLKETHPDIIENHGSVLILLAIMCKKVELFQWVKENLFDKLMTLVFFEVAVRSGALEAVNWFLEHAPPEILNYTDQNGTNILHLAGLSKSDSVFEVILEKKKELLRVPDTKGRYLTEYALNTWNPKRVNRVLQLNKSTTLSLVYVPWGFNEEEPNQNYIMPMGKIEDILVSTANQVLDINFNIQKVDCGIHVLPEEAYLKIQRNITIAHIEKAKPVIIYWLFVLSELEFPLDIMFEISRKILPKEIPQETITCYSEHFFFKNEDTAKTIPLILEEDEDSQEEIKSVNYDTFFVECGRLL